MALNETHWKISVLQCISSKNKSEKNVKIKLSYSTCEISVEKLEKTGYILQQLGTLEFRLKCEFIVLAWGYISSVILFMY